jgi:hypothetical protein
MEDVTRQGFVLRCWLRARTGAGNLPKPVIPNDKQKWRSGMTKNEIRVFEAVAGDALASYGYARAIDDPAISKGEEWFRPCVRRSIGRLKDRKGQKEQLILLGLLSRRVARAAVGRLASRGPLLRFGVKDPVK